MYLTYCSWPGDRLGGNGNPQNLGARSIGKFVGHPDRRVFVGITFLLDYVLALMGASKFGASRLGRIGALLGGFIGLFIYPIFLWLLIGPFVAALMVKVINGENP
tara:strand:+ start:330 stop:644 length:315 start_codon:yes stop_codon:yes gene_type:complete